MKRLALLCLILSLLAPRLAWAAHFSGHEAIASFTTAHSHHSGAAQHAHSTDSAGVEEDTKEQGGGDFTHAHPPAFALAFMALLPSDSGAEAFSAPHLIGDLPDGGGIHLQSYSTLLRPPRTA
jgi:hypothetical protein